MQRANADEATATGTDVDDPQRPPWWPAAARSCAEGKVHRLHWSLSGHSYSCASTNARTRDDCEVAWSMLASSQPMKEVSCTRSERRENAVDQLSNGRESEVCGSRRSRHT